MRKAYIVAAKRSAIGSFMGGLTNIKLVDLGAAVLKETIQQSGIDPKDIDEVLVGNVSAAGLGQNIGRQVSIAAGIPVEVCAQSINMLCGSGLKAVMEATLRIQAGFGDIYVAGGVESMTNAPFLVPSKVRNGVKMGDMKLVDSMLHDGLTDGMYNIHMGVTADNIAKKYKVRSTSSIPMNIQTARRPWRRWQSCVRHSHRMERSRPAMLPASMTVPASRSSSVKTP